LDRIQLKRLRLNNFRNYEQLQCSFNEHINVITGLNGVGKTSILDAVYYLCNGRSYHAHLDSYIYRKGTNFFFLEAELEKGDDQFVVNLRSSEDKGKQIKLDDKVLKSIGDLVGRFPAFMIAPKDILILVESSVERRRLVDKTISQVDSFYLKSLMSYNKLLKQRNAALKGFLKSGRSDRLIIDALDARMVEPAAYICAKRQEYVDAIAPVSNRLYGQMSSGSETIRISYKSKLLDKSYLELAEASRKRDFIMGKTHEGIHRDDLRIFMDDMDIRKTGSQGQLKSAIIAIKLAQIDWVKELTQASPIILLDDIFDKLDKSRVEKLIDICANSLNAQIFITDTEADRVATSLRHLSLEYLHYKINEGKTEYV